MQGLSEMRGQRVSVTVIGADVAVLPATSLATAVSVWAPYDRPDVDQLTEYGELESVLILDPSR